ncbi:MAG TPA: hypothetical protein VK112_09055 [Fodinibius sp.]|nr:hypothetical protein [Fodinibius sp.]
MGSSKISTFVLVALLILAAAGLLAGLHAGLLRLGLLQNAPLPAVSPLLHGPLMINGFLGTLIGLERAAALEKTWAYFSPLFMAAAIILLLSGWAVSAQWAFILGALILTAIMAYLYYLQPKTYHLIMALGATSLLIGNLLYLLGYPIYMLVGWWAAFPMLTIFGERLELNRIMRPPQRAQHLFLALNLGIIVALLITHFNLQVGWSILSLLLIGVAGWLTKYDIARRTIKSIEWTKYSAISLLSGYGWIILAGIFGLTQGFKAAGPLYDGLLHMIFVGFVFSMIFAHSSVIIPSLSGKLVPYHPYFYLPLFLLHGFLMVRIIGDLFGWHIVRQVGGYGNVLAILLFLGGMAVQLVRASLHKRSISMGKV